jgi:hypothetical protein
MGLAVADYDLDADEDILVTNLTREGATLYRNDGKNFFTDISAQTAIRRLTFANTGFGVGWIDVDVDERPDLVIVNGAVTIIDSQRGNRQPFRQPPQLLMNRAGTFEIGSLPALNDVSRGAALGDVDNDGDVDIVISNNAGPARLLLNQFGSRRNWLRVRPTAKQPTGALVILEGATRRSARLRTDGSYLAANEPVVHFTLADVSTPQSVIVNWPDRKAERWPVTRTRTVLKLREGTGSPVP